MFLGFRNFINTFLLANSLRGESGHSNEFCGPLEEKLQIWNHPFLKIFETFLAGRLLSAQSAFENFPVTVAFSQKWNFYSISYRSDFISPWRNKNRLKNLMWSPGFSDFIHFLAQISSVIPVHHLQFFSSSFGIYSHLNEQVKAS